MYATSSHVLNQHNLPHYNNHVSPTQNPHYQQHSPVQNQNQIQSHNPQHSNNHSHRSQQSPAVKDPITVIGIPSVSIQNNQLVVGTSQSSSTRSYTPLKVLGDGSFGTVWLCDWHGTLPPNTPLSPMQCGAGARPAWVGKRLVAVKRMKRRWDGGWDECQKLKELESLRAIPFHPNIIPLYDFFLLPASKELYFVFESMEGNLYHLIKARKGRALAGGLVASIFHQIVSGLDHIHTSGYFHRDMKPENVLVTTTGLFDYTSVSPLATPTSPKEKDVVAIIKLADFGLARETKSKPPYTEYVSTRWYRAPEVLLLSRDYSNPVDMWALGTIMAELVNLMPLFPGSDQVDQVARICEILGDPSDAYGRDSQRNLIGGGPWAKGVKLAKAVGFQFPKIEPKDIYSLFDRSVPVSLIHCIRDLLRYDPEKRLTSRQCFEHIYLQETIPRNNIPIPSGLRIATSNLPSSTSTTASQPSLSSLPPRTVPVSSNNSAPLIQEGRRNTVGWGSNGHQASSQVDYPMDSPQHEQTHNYIIDQTTDIQGSPMVQEYPARPHIEPDPPQDNLNGHIVLPPPTNKLSKLSSLSFGRKSSNKWGLGMFGSDKSLPPVDEVPAASSSTPSLKRTQSSSTDSKSLRELSPVQESPSRNIGDIKKNNKKEAERLQREAEKQRRKLAEKMNRDQARAVMHKRNQMTQKTSGIHVEWQSGPEPRLGLSESKGKQAAFGPIRQNQSSNGGAAPAAKTINAAAGRFVSQQGEMSTANDRGWRDERFAKARRREFDDDHSMSSSEVHSISRMSSMSFATVDSDPGPSRIRNRPSLFGINRMTSMSSLRTSFDDFSPSARSSNSYSLDGQLAHDFRTQASVNNPNHIGGSVSPPPLHTLSLSPTLSPPLSPSPPWIQVQQHDDLSQRGYSPSFASVPPTHQLGPGSPLSPFDLLHPLPPSPFNLPSSPYSQHSPGHTPKSAKSAINPIFKVPPLPPSSGRISPQTLPPFSQLEAVAGGDYSPISPMSFSDPPPEDA